MSSKFSRPTYWVGLSMVILPIFAMLAAGLALVGFEVGALVLGTLVCAALTAVLFGKGHSLMMDAEYSND